MPTIAVLDALGFPSDIFTAKPIFFSGIVATKTPSAPFLKNTFFLKFLLK